MRVYLFLLSTVCFSLTAQDTSPSRLEQFTDATQIDVHGFLDYRYGQRLQHDDFEGHDSLNEPRLQLDLSRIIGPVTLQFRGDFLHNELENDSHDVNLERGEGFFDLRELYTVFSPLDWIDMKVGRQILTWGTGDYLFINDLFPKDWRSFFLGRDDEYLKAPSDAIFAGMFFKDININIVYTPRFDSDRFITGEYISYYSNMAGTRVGRNAIADADIPNTWFRDDELALRAYRTVGSYEVAAYFYDGFWKSPGGMDITTGRPIFPDLTVYGASGRGNLAGGVGNIELGYYQSRDDEGGSNPFINNSEIRGLVGYQREVITNLTMGLQYYLEWMMDYGDYERTLPAGSESRDEFRHVVTLSLRQMLMNQNLTLSLFTYYSPSDDDSFYRPQVSYKYSDALQLFAGANVFAGSHEHTFFNQFEHNSNIYAGVRYSF